MASVIEEVKLLFVPDTYENLQPSEGLLILNSSGKYQVIYYSIVRDKDKSLAGIIAEVKNKLNNETYYSGIVAANSDGKY